jgi:prepilin-type N-terminal cleavage/methylation domain-containing protein
MTKIQNQSGFTLTELLISVVIIAIGVVGFATAVGLASTELWIGQRDTEVAMLMIDQAERIKAQPFDSVQPGTRVEGSYLLAWQVQGTNPKRVILVAQFENRRGRQLADTIVILKQR